MAETNVPQHFSDPARYILHPTDFSDSAEHAFAHALRLALANKANLTIMHVDKEDEVHWENYPSVRRTLERWGMLAEGSHRADVAKLGIGIEKRNAHDTSLVHAIGEYLYRHPIDMLVLATSQRQGFARLLHRSQAEATASKLALPTLFVPAHGHGCVSLETGQVTLNQILIPVDHEPRSDEAIERGLRALSSLGASDSKLTLLHVGTESSFPHVVAPKGPWHVSRSTREGNPVTEILGAAAESKANLIIMATKGTHGFLDALRGTTTEQVIRQATCPVLSLPAAV